MFWSSSTQKQSPEEEKGYNNGGQELEFQQPYVEQMDEKDE